MNPAIAAEEQRLEKLLAAAEQAHRQEDAARQALVDAKVGGKAESQQKKLLATLIEAQADAQAAAAAADQQAATLQAMREKIAQQEFEAALDAVENRMDAARSKYRDHHELLAEHLRAVTKEWGYLLEARDEELRAVREYVKIEAGDGEPTPLAAITMMRTPQLGQFAADVCSRQSTDRVIASLKARG